MALLDGAESIIRTEGIQCNPCAKFALIPRGELSGGGGRRRNGGVPGKK
jgi:hypothetical protein